jgi:hypothetical protein
MFSTHFFRILMLVLGLSLQNIASAPAQHQAYFPDPTPLSNAAWKIGKT